MTDETQTDDMELLGAVLGRVPSGIFIVTAQNSEGQETGMLASWVQQAAFIPPMLTLAVNKSRYIREWIAEVPKLVVNVVGTEQKDFLRHFGRGFEPGEPAFEGLNIVRTKSGMPALGDAIGYLEGEVVGELEAGDHVTVLLSLIDAGSSGDPTLQQPMTHVRKNGFGY